MGMFTCGNQNQSETKLADGGIADKLKDLFN